jgi:large subunit ribosomal protein L10
MLREQKEQVVAELVERLQTSETLLVADYRGLTHAELDAVRSELLRLGARFAVAKNTLTRRAADQAGVDGLQEFLTGPTAIAFVSGGDAVGVAKVLSETARQTRRLELKGGLLERRAITADEVRNLATLPPAEVLRAQLLGAIVGPVASIVGIFAAPLRDLVGVIDARISQLEAEGGPAAAAEAPVEVEPSEESQPPVEAEPSAAAQGPNEEEPAESEAEGPEEPASEAPDGDDAQDGGAQAEAAGEAAEEATEA